MILFLPLGFILGALAILFIIENNTLVALTFFGYGFESSIALVVILALLVGIVFTLFMSIPGIIGNMMKVASLRKENRQLREEAESYKQTAQAAAERLNRDFVPS